MGKRSRSKLESRLVVTSPAAPAAVAEGGNGRGALPRLAAVCAVLAVVVLAVYAQVRTHQFINYDDPLYVSNNADVLGGLTASGVRWAFTSVHAAYWHPVTWLSHQLDVSLFGTNAGAHLLMSVVLHALNAVLLFLWLRLATGAFWRSGLVAALFAVHPLHVESVAWVAERKDVLSALFFLLTLHAYTRWVRTGSRVQYAWSVVALALGLMAKPMLVTAPFALLLLDYWPFQRTKNLRAILLEKLPYLACTIPVIVMTLRTQSVAMSGATTVPLSIRLANAAIAYVKYIVKTFWPSGLAIVYPYPTSISSLLAIVCALIVVAITIFAFLQRQRMPWLTVGWLWFAGMLVPVIGIVQVGQQAMADRFTYLPHIGLFIAVVWSVAALTARAAETRYMAVAAAVVVLFALTLVSYRQIGFWQNSITVFERALDVTENNRLAHLNLGAALLQTGEARAVARAETELRAAAGFKPAEIQHTDLALALSAQGKYDEAVKEAAAAVQANPSSADALTAAGTIELGRGRVAEAIPMLEKANQLSPSRQTGAPLALARGQLLAGKGDSEGAANQFGIALKLDPGFYDAHMNLGALLSRTDRADAAINEFSQAATIRPESAEPHIYLALTQSNEKHFLAAADHIARAIAIDHDGANRLLTDAIHMAPRPTAIDEYLQFLRQQAGVR